jgi:processive 1,2-diacylglycerol beta-glucosyltransferase
MVILSIMKPIVIVHSPVGGGHRAAAEALAQRAEAEGRQVVVLNAFDFAPTWFGELYTQAHLTGQRAMPNFYGAAFADANRRGTLLEPVRLGFDELTFRRLTRHVCALDPETVIVTHHLPLIALAYARRSGALKAQLTCVVTDFTAHAVWAEQGTDLFCVAHESVARDLRAHGCTATIEVTGIPVREAFEYIPPVLPLTDSSQQVRVLCTTGGFGVGPLAAILRSFRHTPNVHITVVCGKSEDAERRAKRAFAHYGLKGEVVGFETNMPKRMQNADIVIGKAGGLTVSEALSAGRPLILVGTVPGNESANEAHVLHSGAGVSAAAKDVGRVVAQFRPLLAELSANARASVVHFSAVHVLHAATAKSAQRTWPAAKTRFKVGYGPKAS